MKRREKIMTKCSIIDCNRKHHARTFCKSHYRLMPDQQLKQKEYNKMKYNLDPQGNIERVLKWRMLNPEKTLESNKRHMKNICEKFGKNINEYRWANISWSKTVKELNDNKCVNCESTGELHAHHIFHKAKYPELSLNVNNGLPLCIPCHKEVHGWGLVI